LKFKTMCLMEVMMPQMVVSSFEAFKVSCVTFNFSPFYSVWRG